MKKRKINILIFNISFKSMTIRYINMSTIIYDFETSGLNPYHDDITEIGCRCLETDETFCCLVQPLSDRLLSERNQEITGITNQMLKKEGLRPIEGYKRFFDVLKSIYDRDEQLTLIAHNGRSFDDIFLKRAHRYLQGEGIVLYDTMMKNINYIDSLNVCRLLHPERNSHSMKSMCQVYNIVNEAEHRAMGDVDALSKIWKQLIIKIKAKYQGTSISHIKYLIYI